MADDPRDKEQAYNTAIIGVGYAGVFALLSYTHDALEKHVKAQAAFLLLASLSVFVLWNVLAMILRGLVTFEMMDPNRVTKTMLIASWVVFLVLSTIPASIAAILLFRAYLRIILS